MIEYFKRHPDKVIEPLLQHVELVLITLVISIAVASVLTAIAMRSERVSRVMNNVLAVVYSVP